VSNPELVSSSPVGWVQREVEVAVVLAVERRTEVTLVLRIAPEIDV
jgi:hypothetical protein